MSLEGFNRDDGYRGEMSACSEEGESGGRAEHLG